MHINAADLPDGSWGLLTDIVVHIHKFYSDVDVVAGEGGITLSSGGLSDEVVRRIALAAASNVVLIRQAKAGRGQILGMLLQ